MIEKPAVLEKPQTTRRLAPPRPKLRLTPVDQLFAQVAIDRARLEAEAAAVCARLEAESTRKAVRRAFLASLQAALHLRDSRVELVARNPAELYPEGSAPAWHAISDHHSLSMLAACDPTTLGFSLITAVDGRHTPPVPIPDLLAFARELGVEHGSIPEVRRSTSEARS